MRVSLTSLLLLLTPACFAEVEYTYIGSPFTYYYGTYNSSAETNITASIWLAAPLGPNVYADVNPLAFSISDGFTTLTNLSPNLLFTSFANVETDGFGNITGWYITVGQSTGGGDWIFLATDPNVDISDACGADYPDCAPTTGEATVNSNQTSWTESVVSATPEPSAFLLVAAGLLGFLVRRHRLMQAATVLFGLATTGFGEVEYTYTGSPFTSYLGTYNSSAETNITASIWLAAPLGPNYTEVSQVTPQAFSISDGSTTLTNLSPNIVSGSTDFYFETDAFGDITGWDMNVVQSTGGGDWIRLLTEEYEDDALACGGGTIGSNCSPPTGEAYVEYSASQPGWSESVVSATPEPSAFLLVAAGLLGFLVRRHRLAQAATVLVGLATTGFGEVVVYTTSNSLSVLGGAYGYVGFLDDYAGSSTIETYSLEYATGDVDFSITLNLDNNSQNTVTSALLSYGDLLSPTSYGYDDYNYGSQGEYVTGSYGCGFFNESTCYTYSSSYTAATLSPSGGHVGPVFLTSISSPSTTWTGSISSGSVDLTTLGFGSDLVNGGTLIINGFIYAQTDPLGISNPGFNSYNNFTAYYDVSGTANASLQLDEVTPEPGTTWLMMAGGVVLCLMGRYRAKAARG